MKISAGAGDITGHPPHLLISHPPFHSHNHRQTMSLGFLFPTFFFSIWARFHLCVLNYKKGKGDKANSLKSLATM